MVTYYKCVRPDGTDFYSGSVLWAPESIPEGGWLVTHPTSDRLSLGDAGTYLSVATVPTDCTGMQWPCRLLEVVPAGRQVLRTADLPNKRVSVAWRVVQELPAWQALGPQGRQVAAIIERAATLNNYEVRRLADACARAAARAAAWDAARAYLVKDLISETHFNALADPWHRVIGEPDGDPA